MSKRDQIKTIFFKQIGLAIKLQNSLTLGYSSFYPLSLHSSPFCFFQMKRERFAVTWLVQ